MINEYSEHLLTAASLLKQTGVAFSGVKFDEGSQAMEVFALQSLSMCSSHCLASALLLQKDFVGEAVAVLRPIEEMLFNIRWIKEPNDRQTTLERVYELEADPYARWEHEIKLIAQSYSQDKAQPFRGPLDEIAASHPWLTKTDRNGARHFKRLEVSFPDRMGRDLRPRYYHIYCFSSLFTHPTPFMKSLYLKESDSGPKNIAALEESLRVYVANSLLFIELIIGFAEEILGSFSPSTKNQRDVLFRQVIDLVEKANKGYFRNPLRTRGE